MTERPQPQNWVCPVCESEHKTARRLANHIGGMIHAYGGPHLEWALAYVQKLERARNPFSIGSQLLPAVIAAIEPIQQQLSNQLDPNPDRFETLSKGYYAFAKTEVSAYDLIIAQLRKRYGTDEKVWWFRGVPQGTRKKCDERYSEEREASRREVECYLDVLDLKNIIKSNWQIFEPLLSGIDEFPGKDQFLKMFEILNEKRRMIMHPLRGDAWGQDDMAFVNRFHQIIGSMRKNADGEVP